jgi:hypothetical protein
MTRGRFLLATSLLLALPAGCGHGNANQAAIQGHITLDAKPVERGSILFAPVDGTRGAVVGGQIKNGQYRLYAAAGPAIGRNRVEIRSVRKTGRSIPKGFGATGEFAEEQVEAVSPRFNAASSLAIDIKPGDNVGDFEVTSR